MFWRVEPLAWSGRFSLVEPRTTGMTPLGSRAIDTVGELLLWAGWLVGKLCYSCESNLRFAHVQYGPLDRVGILRQTSQALP